MKILRTIAAALVTGIPAITMAATWLPAEGIWQIDGANGSGLALDVRDNAIGVGLYTYDDAGNGIWYSGAGVLADGALALDLTRFERGEGDAVIAIDTLPVTLTFAASAAGTLSIDGGAPKSLRHAAFGAPQVEGLDLPSAAGVVTSLPDLRARWAFSPTGPSEIGSVDLRFWQMQRSGDAITFTTAQTPDAPLQGGDFSFTCSTTPIQVGPAASCLLRAHNDDLPPALTATEIAQFDPADLSTTRLAGAPETMIGFRVPSTINAPQSGIWQIAGRFGEGVTLDVRPDLVAIGLYGYDDDGHATWSLATGTIVGDEVEADLIAFSGGSCLACEHSDPQVHATRALRLEFVGATRARLTIDGGEALALSLLPFGADYLGQPMGGDPGAEEFGPHALPAMRGGWVQIGVYDNWLAEEPAFPAAANAFGEAETVSLDGETYSALVLPTAGAWDPIDEFGDVATSSLACADDLVNGTAACRLIDLGGFGDPPSPPTELALIRPWDISATRMSGAYGVNDTVLPIYLFRIPPRPEIDFTSR